MADPNTSQEYASQDRGPSSLATLSSMTGVTAIFVAARLFVRIKLLKNPGLDDYLIVVAMVCGFVNLGINVLAIEAGSGRHFDTLTLEEKSKVIKWTIAAFCPGILSFAVPKLAVVALLTKLTNPSPWHRAVLWLTSTASLLVLFGCVIILYAQCSPSRSQWDFSIKGTCWSPWVLVDYAIVAGTLSACMDLYLAVYPAIVLAKLQMNIKKKLALCGALGIGSVGCVVATYKCTRLPGLATSDFSWNTSQLVIWTCVEGSTIIIAACIPIMQPLLQLAFNRSVSKTPRHYYRSWSDARNHRRHDPHGLDTQDIQLSCDLAKTSKARSTAKVGTRNTTDVDSQESILREDEVAVEAPMRSKKRLSRGWITRTDEVSVTSYWGDKDDGSEKGAKMPWR